MEESKNKQVAVLVADIGGTNARMKLIAVSKDENIPVKEINSQNLKTQNYDSAELLLREYLKPYENTENYPKYAAMGIPGAIVNNTIEMIINIPKWKGTNGENLAKALGLKKVVILNDFVIQGYGVQAKMEEGKDYIVINNKPLNHKDNILVVGPGTGLGVTFLMKEKPEDKYFTAYPSECGSFDYAPRDYLQFRYMKFLSDYFGMRIVSIQFAACGQSLIPMYQFLQPIMSHDFGVSYDENFAKKVNEITNKSDGLLKEEINKEIVAMGLSKKDLVAEKVLEFFVENLGIICGNLGLFPLTYGGFYIVGSLAENLKEVFQRGFFQKGVLSNPLAKDILKDAPIVLVLNKDNGMTGVIEYAKKMVYESE